MSNYFTKPFNETEVVNPDDIAGVSVSAIITAYNRSDYLYYALESAVSQSYPLSEIIVIDDCSSIDLKKVVDDFIQRYQTQYDCSRICYHRLQSNSGANVARNTGITMATSEWLAFLDDDDVWLPEKTLEQVTNLLTMAEHKPIASLCSYRYVGSDELRKAPQVDLVSIESLKRGNPYCGASGLFVKRDVISKLEFDESLPCGQDWDIYVRLAQEGCIVYQTKDLFLYRRGSHHSVTAQAKDMTLDEAVVRLASAYKHRDWLGEKCFQIRAAGQILSYLFHKQDKWHWIKASLRIAGLSATLQVLWRKFFKRLAW